MKMTTEFAGIDVSAWQGDIDFNAVKTGKIKELPISFVMIRISVGKSVDSKAIGNINAALAAGLDVGVYHYSTARNADEAIAEADLVLSTIRENGFDGKLTMPIAFDIEENSVFKLGKDVCTDIAVGFMERIARANYQPILYTYANAYNVYFNKEIIAEYPLWIAGYIAESRLNSTFGIKDYAMWQFGVAGDADYDIQVIGSVSGVKGKCDCDYMYEDLPAKIKAEGKNVFPSESLYTVTINKIPSKAIAEEFLSRAEREGYSGIITEENPPAPKKNAELKIGDKVKMDTDAPVYGSTDKFASWVYSSDLYIRGISGGRIVVSTNTTGDITGAVDKKYLTKI